MSSVIAIILYLAWFVLCGSPERCIDMCAVSGVGVDVQWMWLDDDPFRSMETLRESKFSAEPTMSLEGHAAQMHLRRRNLDVHSAGGKAAQLIEGIPSWRVTGADRLVEIALFSWLKTWLHAPTFTEDLDLNDGCGRTLRRMRNQ